MKLPNHPPIRSANPAICGSEVSIGCCAATPGCWPTSRRCWVANSPTCASPIRPRGFWSEVQRVYENCIWTSLPSSVPLNSIDCGGGRSCPIGTTCSANDTCQGPRPPPPLPPQAETLPGPRGDVSWWDKPVSGGGGTAFAVFGFLVFGMLKEWLSANIPKQYRALAFLVPAAVQTVVYFVFGINVSEPTLIDFIKINGPLGLTVGIGFFVKHTA